MNTILEINVVYTVLYCFILQNGLISSKYEFKILDISTSTPRRKKILMIHPNPNHKKLGISIIQFLKIKN